MEEIGPEVGKKMESMTLVKGVVISSTRRVWGKEKVKLNVGRVYRRERGDEQAKEGATNVKKRSGGGGHPSPKFNKQRERSRRQDVEQCQKSKR